MNHAVRAAGEHHVGVAAADDLGRLADRLAGGGAGGQAVQVGALGVEQAGQVAGRHVRLLLELLLRVEPFEAALGELFQIQFAVAAGLRDHVHEDREVLLPFAGPQVDAELRRIERRVEHAGILDRLHGGGHGELDVAAGELEPLGPLVMVAEIEVFDFRRELRGKVGRIEVADGADAVGAVAERFPHRISHHFRRE